MLRPYLCSKRQDLGFHKQATHRRCGDEPFFTLGSTVHDWRLPKKGPFESTTHLIHMYYIKINLPFLNNILWRILLLDNTLVLSVISFVKYGSTSFFVHCRHYSAQCVLCKVYFSAQPNKFRPILKCEKYYPIEYIFVPACSSARKKHFFKF